MNPTTHLSHSCDVWPLICDIEVVTDGDPRGDDFITESPTDAEFYEAMERLLDDYSDVLEEYLTNIVEDRIARIKGEAAVQRYESELSFMEDSP